MQTERFTVQGAGEFGHIALIRRFSSTTVEVWTDGSEHYDHFRKGVQAKAVVLLNRRISAI